MAARNSDDDKRFVFRPTTKEADVYFIPANEARSNVPSRNFQPTTSPTTIQSADAAPARRIVVIRNPKTPQVSQTPVDLSEFERSHSVNAAPVISDGHKSLYLIRRPIVPPELPQSVDFSEPPNQLPRQPSPVASLQYIRTPSPTKEIITSPDPPRSPQSPPIRPKSSKRPGNSRHYVPYLKRPRSKARTPSPVQTYSTRRSASSNRAHSVSIKRQSLSPSPPQPQLQLEEHHVETIHDQGCCSCFSKKKKTEPKRLSPPLTVENEEQLIQYHQTPASKSAQQIKSAKSVVFVNPDDQSIAVVENSYIKGEPMRPVVKHYKSIKKTRFEDETDDDSTEKLVKKSRRRTCLDCLSRCMCLVIIICFILILIGLAGAAVSAYFLATNSSQQTAEIVGIVVGGVLAIGAICFLCILLACIGSRDGYFSYNDKDSHSGGRAFALIPPSHPNARLYIPRDYMQMVENNYPPSMNQGQTTTSVHNLVYNQPSTMIPVSSMPYNQHQTMYRSNTSTNELENKPNKNNITIEMPERLLTGRRMSPRSRERSLNKMVKNIGHVVEDAKKRYNGDVPTKVIVKVDKHTMQS